MTAAVTEAVERAVRSALDELNGELEQLVAAELERQVEQLAAGVLAERLGTDARASHRDEGLPWLLEDAAGLGVREGPRDVS